MITRIWFRAALVASCLTLTHHARAWEAKTCNGLVRGLMSATTFKMNRCSIPVGSEREQAIQYARGEWAFISGTTLGSRIQLGSGSSACSVTTGDGQFDVSFTPSANIDGAAGQTKFRYAACWLPWHTGEVTEADVFVASNLPTSRQAFDSMTLGARETAIHEFGHALGMNHEDDVMSVMCTTNTCGKLAEHFYWGQLAYGAETTLPDDVHFAATFYGNVPGDLGLPDLALSDWQFVGGGPQLIFSSVSTLVRCPGQTATIRVSHGSKGRRSVTSSSPMQGRIVLSTDSTIGTNDVAVSFSNMWGATGQFFTNDFTFTVPSLSPGTYFVGFILNGNAAITEDTYGNNAIYVRRKIQIPTSC